MTFFYNFHFKTTSHWRRFRSFHISQHIHKDLLYQSSHMAPVLH